MTREEIIIMALKFGASIKTDCNGNGIYADHINVEAFANLVAAAEREACWKTAEAIVPRHTECGNRIAAAIRARS